MLLRGHEGVHRGCGGGQIVIEQAGQRCPPLLFGVLVGGELSGVGTQQVVHAVPAWHGGRNQVRAGQPGEQVLSLGKAGVGKRCGGVGIQVGAGMQTEHPECLPRVG